MANQRIASALSHQADTTGFVPGVGYEEGNRSFSTDAIVVDIEASLDCLYGEDVDLDWEQMLAPVELGSLMFEDCATQLETTNASLLSSDTCACEQSTYWSEATGVNCSSLPIIYYYHPDYLGSVEFITDMRGDPYQFFLNTIWGENLQNQLAFNMTAFSSRFRFNGKEWDEETGNFYYGARYYDPKVSVWLSVDPLAENYPYLSSYNFVANSPLVLVDPDGRAFGNPIGTFFNKVSNWFKGSGFKTDSQLEAETVTVKLPEVVVTAPSASKEKGPYSDQLYNYTNPDGSESAGGFIVGTNFDFYGSENNLQLEGFKMSYLYSGNRNYFEFSGLEANYSTSSIPFDQFPQMGGGIKAKVFNLTLDLEGDLSPSTGNVYAAAKAEAYVASVQETISIGPLQVSYGATYAGIGGSVFAGSKIYPEGGGKFGASFSFALGPGVRGGVVWDTKAVNKK